MAESDSKAKATTALPPDHQLPPYRAQRPIGWLVLAGVLAAAAYWYWHRPQAAPAPATPAVPVTVATATKGDQSVFLDAIGTVTPVYTAAITSQVAGAITAVHFQQGTQVRAGDLLIEIDPRVYQAQLGEAEGALARDTQLLAEARMDQDRYADAWARNAIAKQTLDDQEKLVQQYQGTVANDQATVRYDTVVLGYCRITAPFSGTIGLRLVDPGNVVQAGGTTPLAMLAQTAPITVVFPLAEDDLPQVRAAGRGGVALPVTALDRTAQHTLASGSLESLDNLIDTTTGTVKARAIFSNQDGALFANQFVNVRLLVKTLRGVTLVPDTAIQYNGQNAYVFLITNQTASMRNVTAGVSNGGLTAVTGIQPGDVVATSSFDRLQAGAKVTVVAAPAPAPAGNATP